MSNTENAAFMLEFWNEAIQDLDEAFERITTDNDDSLGWDLLFGIPPPFFGKPIEILSSINPSLKHKLNELWTLFDLSMALIAIEKYNNTPRVKAVAGNKPYSNSNRYCVLGYHKTQRQEIPFCLLPMCHVEDDWSDGPITNRPQPLFMARVVRRADGWGTWNNFGENDMSPEAKTNWTVKRGPVQLDGFRYRDKNKQ